jgi:hypothetical protein
VQAEIERRAKAVEQAEQAKESALSSANMLEPTQEEQAAPPVVTKPVIKPKAVVEVNVSSIYNKSCEGAYLETEESVDQFVEALKTELKSIVHSEKRIRLR